jgi:uncharacterized membrane protein YbhN (UPF0104 family)
LNWVNLQTVGARFSQINPAWLLAGILALLVQQFFLTERWRQILIQCGSQLKFVRLLRFLMIGTFFNQTLPSSVGGDVMRVWLVGRVENWRIATYSVLLDRLVGLTGLAIMVVACLPWTVSLVRDPIGRSALLVIGLGSIGGGLVFLALGWSRLAILQHWSVTRHLAASAVVAMTILRSPRFLTTIFGVTFLTHLITVVTAWCVGRAIGADLSLQNALFLVLPVVLLTAVPISIGGWGMREGAMVAGFAYAGLPQSDGLVVSILFGASYLVVGAVGGLIWLFSDRRKYTARDSSILTDIQTS